MDGPLKDTRKKLKVDDIIIEMWSKLKALRVVDPKASRNNFKAREAGCRHLVMMWCESVATNDNAAVADFQLTWGLAKREFDTPEKKRRRMHDSESTAVVESDKTELEGSAVSA